MCWYERMDVHAWEYMCMRGSICAYVYCAGVYAGAQ